MTGRLYPPRRPYPPRFTGRGMTRKQYRHARSLARRLTALHELPSQPPRILRRLWRLHGWESDDPLLVPVEQRLRCFKADRHDDIPF